MEASQSRSYRGWSEPPASECFSQCERRASLLINSSPANTTCRTRLAALPPRMSERRTPVAATPLLIKATQPATIEPLVDTPVVSVSAPKPQPLWRFALVGLGPLSAMGVFALLVALF